MKTDIYNLIILDESGSMSCVKKQTISGCNETINTIRSAQKQYAETQNHYVSIYAFQSNFNVPSRYLIKNLPVEKVNHIDGYSYNPCGSTPLYDAIGSTLVDLQATVKARKLAIGSVTIITDGMENDSKYYSLRKVADMISKLKEIGWNFNFIGANIDVERTAASLNIDNRLEFQQDEKGTDEMFRRENRARFRYYERVDACMTKEPSENLKSKKKSLFSKLHHAEKNYYDE